MKKFTYAGFSMIEILLVIAFSAAIMWQAFVIYKDVHHAHQMQADMSELLHHGQWFEEVMGQRLKTAGDVSCLPLSEQKAYQKKAVQGFVNRYEQDGWSIQAAKQTDILLLGQCQNVHASATKPQWVQTAYYLKPSATKGFFTLYQKQKSTRAMAMQDHITALNWYFAYRSKQDGVLTAPQPLGTTAHQPIQAVAWKVSFANAQSSLPNKKMLTRIFYGYMGLSFSQ